MTLRERAIAALEYRIPDAVPTFELEFQLTPELMGDGRNFISSWQLDGLSGLERENFSSMEPGPNSNDTHRMRLCRSRI